jgi:hypothetical protein
MRWQNNHYRPTLELLEQRDVPTTATLSGGYLYVMGTSGSDYITISQSSNRISVSSTAITVGSSRYSSIDAGYVNKVVVYGYAGNDVINLTGLRKDAYVYGGSGNDQIYGGAGTNYLDGGSGYSTVVGGSGTNYLVGNGHDHLVGGTGFNWYYEPINAYAPFVSGETVSDVKQGRSPSCQSDAAIAEAVKEGYNFANNIHYVGNYTYRVDLFGGSTYRYVTFNGWYNDNDPIPTASGEYWTILLQRAREEYFGINPNLSYTTAQWDAMNRNTGYRLYSVTDALYAFTGRNSAFMPMSTANPYTLRDALARGAYLVASSPNGSGFSGDGIAYDHAYAVMAVYYSGGGWWVRLYNPWGFNIGIGSSTNGFITLPWSKFVNPLNFHGYTLGQGTAAQVAYFQRVGAGRE